MRGGQRGDNFAASSVGAVVGITVSKLGGSCKDNSKSRGRWSREWPARYERHLASFGSVPSIDDDRDT